MVKGLLGALVAGVLGAAIWGAIGYYTNFESGWIAWIIGGLCGLGAAAGAGRAADAKTGAIAAVVAIAAILGGKYAYVHFAVEDVLKAPVAQQLPEITDEQLREIITAQTTEEMQEQGKKLSWPPGKDLETAESVEDYPKEARAAADKKWRTMTAEQREAQRREFTDRMKQAMGEFKAKMQE